MSEPYKIDISPSAIEQIKRQMEKRNSPSSLRLGVKGAGCQGFEYYLSFDDNSPKERDLIFHISDVQVIIDSKSILFLNGCLLDWESGLLRNGFKFVNPNEKSRCGCGNSIDF